MNEIRVLTERLIDLWYRLHVLFPAWNDTDVEKAIWDRYGKNGTRKLGTVRTAVRSLKECRKGFAGPSGYVKCPWVDADISSFTDLLYRLGGDAVVGDPKDVSFLFGKKLHIGYSVEESPSGYSKEVFEQHFASLTIIRYLGRIVSVCRATIVRQETRGGMSIV